MVSKSGKSKKKGGKENFSQYQYNRRKLKIALEKNCISKELYNQIKVALDEHLAKGVPASFDELLGTLSPLSKLNDILPVIAKEVFKYNQIVIKLAQQFAKNTIIQQAKLQKKDSDTITQVSEELQKVFLQIMRNATNDYLASTQRNIDELLLESGYIQPTQLEFLHNSAEHLEIKALDRKFGEIAVKNEFTTQEIVNQALDEQTERYKKTNKNHIIGDILVEQHHITTETRDEILIIQNRVLEEDWEETLRQVGQSSIEEKEKSALFGAMILKEHLMDENQVVEALKIQAKELEEYRQKKSRGEIVDDESGREGKPRWIGDILVEEFGLSERDRKRIVKKQMEYKIERINLKLGLNLSNAHIELFNEMEYYFELSYSKNNIEAYIKVLNPVPKTMTKDNMIIWLYHKKIRYGRINNAISSLVSNKVKPGKKVLLAQGDPPQAAQVKYKFHFDPKLAEQTGGINVCTISGDTGNNILDYMVLKGSPLISFQKIKGKSGLNVNRCFIAPDMETPLNILKGENVLRNGNSFIAACDGVPFISDQKVLSVRSEITMKCDITTDNLPPNASAGFECDFNVQGAIQSGVILGCRKLKADNIFGKVRATDDVTVIHDISNGEILSKGNVYISSVENSVVTSERSIQVQLHDDGKSGSAFCRITSSIITCDDIFRISDSKITTSVIRAKNKVILKKVTVGERCKFIIGDSIEAINLKKRIEELNSEVELLETQIKELQERSRDLFEKLEKKDIGAIDQEIKTLSRNQRTKEDLDKISELRVIKRQKEKEYEASIDQYSSSFMKNSQQIKQFQDRKSSREKERQELNNRIVALYKKEQEVPELDIRRSMLPAGTVIQFRYNIQVLPNDCEGFVFREEYNNQTHRFELKQHRW